MASSASTENTIYQSDDNRGQILITAIVTMKRTKVTGWTDTEITLPREQLRAAQVFPVCVFFHDEL